jgi:hypothetical protein
MRKLRGRVAEWPAGTEVWGKAACFRLRGGNSDGQKLLAYDECESSYDERCNYILGRCSGREGIHREWEGVAGTEDQRRRCTLLPSAAGNRA